MKKQPSKDKITKWFLKTIEPQILSRIKLMHSWNLKDTFDGFYKDSCNELIDKNKKLEETIGEICRFLLNSTHQSMKTEADRNCLVLNVEDICRRNLDYVPVSKDLCTQSKKNKNGDDKNGRS